MTKRILGVSGGGGVDSSRFILCHTRGCTEANVTKDVLTASMNIEYRCHDVFRGTAWTNA